MVNTSIDTNTIWQILNMVHDPEIPVLPITDLGIVKAVFIENGVPHIHISPTYTGCPAGDVILWDIKAALEHAGITNAVVKTVLYPAWTTDDITPLGQQLLKDYGIAPPINKYNQNIDLESLTVPCPRCNSNQTHLVSAFGSTACKALFQCDDCLEPFDYFKCH